MPAADWGKPLAEVDGLAAWVRSPIPARLAVGAGSALFVHGAVVGAGRPIRGLELAAGRDRRTVMARAMPSPGLARELGDPVAGRAIFWGIAALVPGADRRSIEVELVAELEDGDRVRLPLASIEAVQADVGERASAATASTVAIAMATHEPPPRLLERQLDSLRAQTHADWLCVISDDGSGDESFARLARLVGDDPRFTLSRSAERLGAYANFGRALAMVPATAGYVALCDQDDRWYPEKLETLVAGLGAASLVFSDMRLTDPAGAVIADTYWTSRVPNHENFASLVLGNSVTGAASLFRRELLERALPLPPRLGNLYHDHWLALVAAAGDGIAYVDRPLYDYVQHPDAVIGHAGANRGIVGGGVARRLAALRGRPRGRLREEWRRIYFAEYCRAALTAVALRARLGPAIGARQRRALDLVLAADRSPAAIAWLSARQLRRLRRDETGGSEAGILRGLAWRRALRLRRARDPRDDADLPAGVAGIDPTFPRPPGDWPQPPPPRRGRPRSEGADRIAPSPPDQ